MAEDIKDIFKRLEKKEEKPLEEKKETKLPTEEKPTIDVEKAQEIGEKLVEDAQESTDKVIEEAQKTDTKETEKSVEETQEKVDKTESKPEEEVKSVSVGKTHPPETVTKEEITEDVKQQPAKSIKSLFATGKRENEEFDLSPARPNPKHIITIYGLKGAGKTSLGFTFPVTHGCLSFDNKSLPIAEQMGKGNQIVVFNGVRYLDMSSPDAYLESSNRSWRYLNKLLDTIHNGKDEKGVYDEAKDTRPDWMVVDGGETFQKIAEMVMRYHNNLQPFQGITNKNIWKERRMYIDQLLRKCRQIQKGCNLDYLYQ